MLVVGLCSDDGGDLGTVAGVIVGVGVSVKEVVIRMISRFRSGILLQPESRTAARTGRFLALSQPRAPRDQALLNLK